MVVPVMIFLCPWLDRCNWNLIQPFGLGLGAIPGVLIMLVGWLVQGAAEETLTRGFLLPVFGVRFGPVWGILVSSVLILFPASDEPESEL